MADTTSPTDTTAGKAPSSSRKRKADELSDDSGVPAAAAAQDGPPHLPAPVWGHVLGFMPYAEVRSALLVGKHIAVEAAKYVQTLNVMKECEMYIPATRRFANVEEVNILCLLEGTGEELLDDEDDGWDPYTISEEASSCIPSFIGSFPKLKRAFFGGFLRKEGQRTNVMYSDDFEQRCVGPVDHRDIFRRLVASLFGAFKTGALRRDVELRQVIHPLQCVWPCSKASRNLDANPCQRCRKFIQYLPLQDVIFDSIFQVDFCLDTDDVWGLMSKREGITNAMRCASEKLLCNPLFQELGSGNMVEESPESVFKQLSQKWRLRVRNRV